MTQIRPTHPLEAKNQAQQQMLQELPAAERKPQALLLSYANATYRYHDRSKEFHPSQQDYREWLEGLPEPIREEMENKGFEYCQRVTSFTRYVMEKNDIGQEKFVRELMGEKAYREYLAIYGE